jgi:hypothetical protein
MKNSIIKISFIIAMCLFINCSEKSNEFFDPSYWSGPYKGITFTNQFGAQLKIDPDDWCVSQTNSNNSSTVLPTAESYAFIPAFPNPVSRENENLTIRFYTSEESNIKITINSDKLFTIKLLTDRIFERGLHEIEWDLKNDIGNKVPAGIYRCYMKAEDFSCHGDIWIK